MPVAFSASLCVCECALSRTFRVVAPAPTRLQMSYYWERAAMRRACPEMPHTISGQLRFRHSTQPHVVHFRPLSSTFLPCLPRFPSLRLQLQSHRSERLRACGMTASSRANQHQIIDTPLLFGAFGGQCPSAVACCPRSAAVAHCWLVEMRLSAFDQPTTPRDDESPTRLDTQPTPL